MDSYKTVIKRIKKIKLQKEKFSVYLIDLCPGEVWKK